MLWYTYRSDPTPRFQESQIFKQTSKIPPKKQDSPVRSYDTKSVILPVCHSSHRVNPVLCDCPVCLLALTFVEISTFVLFCYQCHSELLTKLLTLETIGNSSLQPLYIYMLSMLANIYIYIYKSTNYNTLPNELSLSISPYTKKIITI